MNEFSEMFHALAQLSSQCVSKEAVLKFREYRDLSDADLTADKVKELLDWCVHGGENSDFEIKALDSVWHLLKKKV